MAQPIIRSIRGMNDLLPADSSAWQRVEGIVTDIFQQYGYQEIRFPILESTALFCRSIGEVTDIVEKEMYTFDDRNGDSLSMRPEGTASCLRAVIQASLLDQPQRLWYCGPMFRYERPQKGRLRQFHQFGLEAFGYPGPDIDAEIIALNARVWSALGLSDAMTLQLNTLGSSESRKQHKAALLDYLTAFHDQLDADSQRRLSSNPLRILDSKNPETQKIVENAPKMVDFLDASSQAHYQGVKDRLDAIGVAYVENPTLVRGLDYYSETVFEWTTDRLGAQGTVCGGGRYDALVQQMSGRAGTAFGFGMGVERLMLLIEAVNPDLLGAEPQADIVVLGESQLQTELLHLAEQVRTELPHLRTVQVCGGGNFKRQFKRADRSGAQVALVLGAEEIENGEVSLKWLREEKSQERLSRDALLQVLRSL